MDAADHRQPITNADLRPILAELLAEIVGREGVAFFIDQRQGGSFAINVLNSVLKRRYSGKVLTLEDELNRRYRLVAGYAPS